MVNGKPLTGFRDKQVAAIKFDKNPDLAIRLPENMKPFHTNQNRLSVATCIFLLSGCISGFAQNRTMSRAHSHNEYLQQQPFRSAYNHGFGSVEADLFYRNDSLFVAHEKREISPDRTFESLYLDPIIRICRENNGNIAADSSRRLQLLIDMKTPYGETLALLVRKLAPYREFLSPAGKVKIVVSGNTPPPSAFGQYPDYIFFDGRPEIDYPAPALARLGLISQTFRKYSNWDGDGQIPAEDLAKLQKIVGEAHKKGKPFRFWASPDNKNTWKTLLMIGADFLNTDKIEELSAFLAAPGN
ncbi:hypothetical protein GCM10023091_33430 [Ravibacter arvi]|uniref:Alkaline phosphatase n=2 Tax=Ravibacter arvi TaxID=2051041 RepID=A0ABP8M721_9BACT